jgi:O-antigen ligase
MGLGLGLHEKLTVLLYVGAVASVILSLFRPQIGVYFLVPLLPLQTAREKLFDFPLGNNFVDILLAVILLSALIHARGRLVPKTRLNVLLATFVILTYISLWWGSYWLGVDAPVRLDDPRLATWKNYMVMPVLFFTVVAVIREPRQMKLLLALMCLSLLAADRAFYNSLQWRNLATFSNRLRDAGPLGFAGPNGFAAFVAQMMVFLAALYGYQKKLGKLAIVGLLAITGYCLLYSYSRGAYLAVLVGLLFVGVLRERKILLLLIVLLLAWQVVLPLSVQERIFMTYQQDQGFEASGADRLRMWSDALEVFLHSPVFGTGFATYRYMHRIEGYNDTHNLYLKVLVETGVVGLLLLLTLFAAAFILGYRLFRSSDDPFLASIGFGLAAMMVSTVVLNVFGDRWTFYLQINGFLWTLLAFVVRGQALLEAKQAEHARESFRTASIRLQPVPSWVAHQPHESEEALRNTVAFARR